MVEEDVYKDTITSVMRFLLEKWRIYGRRAYLKISNLKT